MWVKARKQKVCKPDLRGRKWIREERQSDLIRTLQGADYAALSRPLKDRRRRESKCEAKVKRNKMRTIENYWRERFTSFQFLVHCVKPAWKKDSHSYTPCFSYWIETQRACAVLSFDWKYNSRTWYHKTNIKVYCCRECKRFLVSFTSFSLDDT